MITKLIEIRDRATLIVVMAIKLNQDTPTERSYFGRSGYADGHIILLRLEDCLTSNDPYDWAGMATGRTMKEAHFYIESNFDSLNNGDVVDVEFILGETPTPKTSHLIAT